MAHHMKGVKYIRIIYNAIHLPMIDLLVKTDAIMGIQEHCKCLRGYKDINKSYGYIGETGGLQTLFEGREFCFGGPHRYDQRITGVNGV